MRTTEKDILMIVKGHYNHNKYKSLEKALDGYYRKHYGISKKELPVLSHRFMLTLWFNDCVKEFLIPETIQSFWRYVIQEKTFKEKYWFNENDCTEFYEVLYHRIVKWLHLLKVRDDDGNYLIDLSDYEGNVI